MISKKIKKLWRLSKLARKQEPVENNNEIKEVEVKADEFGNLNSEFFSSWKF